MRFCKTRSEAEGGFEPFDRAARKSSRRGSDERVVSRKVQQLCAQVREVIGLALSERCDDPVLERLSVVSVSPAPDATRLMITVTVDPDGDELDEVTVLDALKRLRGELRYEVATEINRKKTPELAFELAPSWGGEPEQPIGDPR